MGKLRRFLPVLVLMICMLAMVGYALWSQSGDLLGQVQFLDSRHSQELDLFYDREEDCYVLFLPSFTSPGDIQCSAPKGMRVTYDLENALTEPATVELGTLLRRQQMRLRLMQTSNPLSVFIHGQEGLIPYLNGDKNNSRDVVVQFLDESGSSLLQSTAAMYGRGNGSWESPSKKPYNLEFAQPVSVGPFQDVTKLCLLAEFSDESRMRNSLAYYAGQELGVDYASPYQYANVYVNGEFLGLYGIVTKQEYRKHLETDKIQAVFEIATAQNRVEFFSDLGWRINVIHGSKGQVQQIIQSFEEALAQGDWEACESYINVPSFAQKYALEEFLANLDLAYGSQYFYLDGDGQINCMLPWDYDWTLGSSYEYYNTLQAYELKVHRNSRSWYALLMEQFPFREAAVSVWKEQFDDAFLQKLETHLKTDIETIAGSWVCDRLRWKYEAPYNAFDLRSGVEDLPGFYDLFRDYFYTRRDFLVNYYSHWWDYNYLRFYDGVWGNLYIPKDADLWSYLDRASILNVEQPGETLQGWYYKDRPLQEITEPEEWMEIQGRYELIRTEEPLPLSWWLALAVVAAFAAISAGLFFVIWKERKKRGINGSKEKVPT